MFKKAFFLAVFAALFSTLVYWMYAYAQKDLFDFSEKANITSVGLYNLAICMFASIVFVISSKLIVSKVFGNVITGILISGVCIGLVFALVLADDFQFKSEAGSGMQDYFKGFLFPILFFPSLSWFTFKPLFIRD